MDRLDEWLPRIVLMGLVLLMLLLACAIVVGVLGSLGLIGGGC